MTIQIYGEIGFEVLDHQILQQIDEANGQPIELAINSPGGDVFQGLAIYNRLLQHKGEVVITIEGIAASIASVIAMAGTRIRMGSSSILMIHNPHTIAKGDQHQFAKVSETLAIVRQTLLTAYLRKTGLPEADLVAMLDEETWMDPATALRLGFIDEIMDSELDLAACLEKFDLTPFKNAPEAVMKQEQPKVEEAPVVESKAPAVSAAQPKEVQMDTEKQAADIQAAKDAAIVEERKRVSEINGLVLKARLTPEFANQLVTEGVSLSEARDRILDKLVSTDMHHSPAVVVEDEADKKRAAAEEWILARVGHVEGGKRVVASGDNPYRGAKLLDIARDSLERAGVRVQGMHGSELALKAITHSTSDFPVALENVMHKTLLGAFTAAGDTWRAFCATGDLSDFRPHYRYLMGSFSNLTVVNENGEFQDGTMDDARKESITATTKGRILNLSRQMIVNDDMSVFTGASRMMGRAAARTLENDVYALLAQNAGMGPTMGDGVTLFHSDHANVTSGTLSAAALEAARAVLKRQVLPNANTGVVEYLDVQSPPVFLSAVEQEGTARVINDAQYDPDTANKLQKPNFMRGFLGTIVGTPRLSSTPYFLFADPSEIPVLEVGFLNGVQAPYLEMQEGFRVDGVSWKVRFDYGVAAVNWLGAVRSTGA